MSDIGLAVKSGLVFLLQNPNDWIKLSKGVIFDAKGNDS